MLPRSDTTHSIRLFVLFMLIIGLLAACSEQPPAATAPPAAYNTTAPEATSEPPKPTVKSAAIEATEITTDTETTEPTDATTEEETGIWYQHPSETFSVQLPETADIVDEVDEGVDILLDDTSILMMYFYEADTALDTDTINDEMAWAMDEYANAAGIITDYDVAPAEPLNDTTFTADFSYTSDDYDDGSGTILLTQQEDSVFLMLLMSPHSEQFTDAWDIAVATFTTDNGVLGEQLVLVERNDNIADTTDENEPDAPEETNVPATGDTTDLPQKTWLVMIYADADDEVLEEDIFIDINEIERIGSTDRVQIVAQLDRYDGAFDGDGDWTSTRRYYITQDDDLSTIHSELIEDLGEADMADGDTLVDFVTWSMEQYPADELVLILSDHGAGWPGGWNDPDPDEPGKHGTILDSNEDTLLLMEFAEALATIQQRTGIGQLSLIGFDACLMAHLEVFTAIAPYATYSVASQETEPAMGWAYASFLQALVDNPDMNADELARAIVKSYIDQDIRITDDDARSAFLSAMGASTSFSAQEVASHFGNDITLAAVDLQAIPMVNSALDTLVELLVDAKQKDVASARTYAQSFEHVFGDDVPSSYIDVSNFAKMLAKKSTSEEITDAALNLEDAISHAILLEKHGKERPGATGISIYFPTSKLYQSPYGGYELYSTIANRFSEETLWDNFLAYYYTGQEITNLALTTVDSRSSFIAPGASELSMTPLVLSSETVAGGESITIDTEITGENIGYIYSYVAYYDKETGLFLSADMDYVDIGETLEIDGVHYPDWGEEGIELEYEWEPSIYKISDGTTSTFALLSPDTFGATAEDTVYYTEGTYTFTDSGKQRYAELLFDGTGALVKVLVFSNMDGTGAPRQIVPSNGDTFTPYMEWIEEGDDEEDVTFAYEEGDTLTFGDTPFTWSDVVAPPGEYIIGFIAEDLDGNSYEEYATVTVTE